MDKGKAISELLNRLSKLEKDFISLHDENIHLKKDNEYLKLRVAELESRCNSNSSNSSRPPSSDGYQKKPAFPRNLKGKKGGQKGHKGKGLNQI